METALSAEEAIAVSRRCASLGAMSTTELAIAVDPAKIAAFCRERGIRKLSVFGSALRGDFDPVRSEVDVLAEFEPGALEGVGFGTP